VHDTPAVTRHGVPFRNLIDGHGRGCLYSSRSGHLPNRLISNRFIVWDVVERRRVYDLAQHRVHRTAVAHLAPEISSLPTHSTARKHSLRSVYRPEHVSDPVA